MDKLEALQSFSFEGNISQGWKLWLKHFEFYLTATEKDRNLESIEIYEIFNFDNLGDEMRLASVLEKFSEYYNPRKNITILCHKFFTYQQHEGQHFHDFVTELKKLRSECEFETIHDSLIKDMIVCDTHNNYLRECLS